MTRILRMEETLHTMNDVVDRVPTAELKSIRYSDIVITENI